MTRSSPPSTRALEQARARLEEQLAASPDDARLLLLLARATERLGRYEEAATLFQRGAKALRGAGDRAAEAAAWLEAAQAYARGRHPAKARAFFQRAVAGYELVGEAGALARARLAQARFLLDTGAAAEARQQLERCVGALDQQQAWDELGWVHERLCAILADAGELDGALEHAKAAVKCAASAKDRSRFGARLSAVSRVHLALGNRTKAKSYQQKALPHLREAGEPDALFEALARLRALALSDDDLDAAEQVTAEAVEVADALDDLEVQGEWRIHLAEVRLRAGADALGPLREAIDRLHRAGDPHGSGAAHRTLAVALLREGDRAGAARALERAEDLFRMVADEARVAEVASARAELAAGRWAP